MMPRWARVLCSIFFLGHAASASAQAQPLAKRPYDLQLVVLLSEHRFLSTEVFQDQFPRDLVRQIDLALGDLVRAEVTRSHPLAEAIRRDGLESPLDAWDEVSDRRTWFFVVRFMAGQFHVQARFYDGFSGFAVPITRSFATGDRDRLAPLAAQLVADDFPLIGTVTNVKNDKIDLMIQGGEIAEARLANRLPIGSVFAVSRIVAQAGKLKAQRIPFAVLETKSAPANGSVVCEFIHRFQEDRLSQGPGVAGYRALLLPTKLAPLKLQFVDPESGRNLAGLQVKVSEANTNRSFDLISNAAGLIATPEKISRLALVKLSQGPTTLAQFPVPVFDDRVLVCPVSVRPEAEANVGVQVRLKQWFDRLFATLQFVGQRFDEQRVLLNQSLESSLKHAKQTLAFVDQEIVDLRAERDELLPLLKKAFPKQLPHDEGGKGLLRLQHLRKDIHESVQRIEKAIQDRDILTAKQQEAVKLVEQAALSETQARFDEAIKLYEQAVALLPEPGKVGERLESLKKDWAIKNPTHAQARKFLIETWPKLKIDDLKNNLIPAQEALHICRLADDNLTPKCFLIANVKHLTQIARIVEKLRLSRTPDDRQRLQTWTDVVLTLRRLSNPAEESKGSV